MVASAVSQCMMVLVLDCVVAQSIFVKNVMVLSQRSGTVLDHPDNSVLLFISTTLSSRRSLHLSMLECVNNDVSSQVQINARNHSCVIHAMTL